MLRKWVLPHLALLVIVRFGLFPISTVTNLKSGDGYIRRDDAGWVIGTAMVEKTINLDRGNLILSSFKNKASRREYIQGAVPSDEIRLTADGEEITGGDGKWTLVREEIHQTAQGELQLDLTYVMELWKYRNTMSFIPGALSSASGSPSRISPKNRSASVSHSFWNAIFFPPMLRGLSCIT